MLRIWGLLTILVCHTIGYAQQPNLVQFETEKPQKYLEIDGFSYPIFLNGEQHASFLVAYDLSKSLKAELKGFYDTYLLGDVFKVSLAPKWYASKRTYFFSGMEIEKDLDKYGNEPPPVRLYLINGVGYDLDDKFTIEGGHRLQFNKTDREQFAPPIIFSLGGKYKF